MKKLHFHLIWIFIGILFWFPSCKKEKLVIEENKSALFSSFQLDEQHASTRSFIIEEDVQGFLREHGDLIAQYPSEITLENWEKFIYAPQVVIDYHTFLQNAAISISNKNTFTNSALMPPPPPCTGGLVSAYDGDYLGGPWRAVENVTVTQEYCSTQQTTNGLYCNYDLEDLCLAIPVCMSYVTSPLEGVSALDLVRIQKHLLNIERFTRVQQYLAADADRNGIIDEIDREEIKKLLLYHPSYEWSDINPATLNVLFIPEFAYQNVQDQLVDNGTILPSTIKLLYAEADGNGDEGCKDYNNFNANRRVIKKGDVNCSIWIF